ncbi:hypothetical protein J3A78_007569 [Streptomyces sp. PvR006]|uniref:hypothetical protein n=1 Tax=Streptomyces sp. PvR006 TaxID=2817860 RepID=UPI001AE6867A|nr:hypothetical protein [Streptomyces sp. PvR006]MBP2587091.1 hypothetical protein [Streptomyces sp. PvR006]
MPHELVEHLSLPVEALAAWAPELRGALVGLGQGDFVSLGGTLMPDKIWALFPRRPMQPRRISKLIAATRTP